MSMEMWEREDDKNHGSTPRRVSEEMSVEESERELECVRTREHNDIGRTGE